VGNAENNFAQCSSKERHVPQLPSISAERILFPAQPLARQLKQIRNAQSNGGSNAAIIIRYGGSGVTAQPVGWESLFRPGHTQSFSGHPHGPPPLDRASGLSLLCRRAFTYINRLCRLWTRRVPAITAATVSKRSRDTCRALELDEIPSFEPVKTPVFRQSLLGWPGAWCGGRTPDPSFGITVCPVLGHETPHKPTYPL